MVMKSKEAYVRDFCATVAGQIICAMAYNGISNNEMDGLLNQPNGFVETTLKNMISDDMNETVGTFSARHIGEIAYWCKANICFELIPAKEEVNNGTGTESEAELHSSNL